MKCKSQVYETSCHCSLFSAHLLGGSLQSLIEHDNGCPEGSVRRFGWDLVQGLKHIHKSGIVVSYLNPSKVWWWKNDAVCWANFNNTKKGHLFFLFLQILLDGSGILKFANFCLTKTAGGTRQDLVTFLTSSQETIEDDPQVSIDSIKTKLQGWFSTIFAVISSWRTSRAKQKALLMTASTFWVFGYIVNDSG